MYNSCVCSARFKKRGMKFVFIQHVKDPHRRTGRYFLHSARKVVFALHFLNHAAGHVLIILHVAGHVLLLQCFLT